MVELSELELISGFSSIIMILFNFFLGIIMIRRYTQNKDRNVLFMSITMMLVSQPWWSYATALLFILTTGKSFPLVVYLIIGHIFQPVAILLWMIVITELIWKKNQKFILSLSAIFSAIYETTILYAIFVEPEMFATLEGPLDLRYLSLFLFCQVFALIVVIITGIMFFRETRKSEKPENRLKGTLFLIAVLSYAIGAIIDSALHLNLISLLIVRILLASSAFEIYGAFAMPKWIKKLFLREE